jgi:S1-C subfamily serine protease
MNTPSIPNQPAWSITIEVGNLIKKRGKFHSLINRAWGCVLTIASATAGLTAEISSGSGVVIGTGGEVLTNSHVFKRGMRRA